MSQKVRKSKGRIKIRLEMQIFSRTQMRTCAQIQTYNNTHKDQQTQVYEAATLSRKNNPSNFLESTFSNIGDWITHIYVFNWLLRHA